MWWVVSITPRPRFSPGEKPPVPIVQEAGWAPEPVWTQRLEKKSCASVGDRTPTVQSVVRHCTDWATPAPNLILLGEFLFFMVDRIYRALLNSACSAKNIKQRQGDKIESCGYTVQLYNTVYKNLLFAQVTCVECAWKRLWTIHWLQFVWQLWEEKYTCRHW
jgi:hypothetical protein